MSGESPVDVLRRAAQAAPAVLPGALGVATAAWLLAEAECHATVPEVAESASRVLSSVTKEISGEDVEVDFSVTVSTLDKAFGFAREVLALAEQQSARGDVYVYRKTGSLLTPETKEVAPGVNVDADDDGLVGVEVLDAVRVEIGGYPIAEGRVGGTVLPAPPIEDGENADTPQGERVGALRILGGNHLYVKLAQPASEPWHYVYSLGDQNYSGWQSNECMEGTVPAGRIPFELAVPESPEDLVEAVAREICNVGRDHDLWATDEVGESTREDLRAEARAAISVMQLPGGINPAVQDMRLTPEELAAVEARFKAARPWRQRANRWMENEQLYAEIARLTAGADLTPPEPGVRLTPGQWIAQWNDASAEHRWSWADAIIDAADEERECRMRDHAGELAALRAQLAATQAMSAVQEGAEAMRGAFYVRWKPGEPREGRVFEPLAADHPAAPLPCPVCNQLLGDGRRVQLVAVGPDDEEAERRHAEGRWYSAAAVLLHVECVAGFRLSEGPSGG